MMGAETNAGTSLDSVSYYINTTSQHTAQAIDLLSDWMQHSKIEPAELAREKDVILREFEMGEGEPGPDPLEADPGRALPGAPGAPSHHRLRRRVQEDRARRGLRLLPPHVRAEQHGVRGDRRRRAQGRRRSDREAVGGLRRRATCPSCRSRSSRRPPPRAKRAASLRSSARGCAWPGRRPAPPRRATTSSICSPASSAGVKRAGWCAACATAIRW